MRDGWFGSKDKRLSVYDTIDQVVPGGIRRDFPQEVIDALTINGYVVVKREDIPKPQVELLVTFLKLNRDMTASVVTQKSGVYNEHVLTEEARAKLISELEEYLRIRPNRLA